MDWIPVAIAAGFFGAIGVITGALAVRKGYQFWPWLLAGGVIGLVVLAFLPFANAPALPDMEKRARAENGNRIGRRIAVVSLAIALIRVLASS